MFVQVIEGQVSDLEGLRRQMDKWMTDLRPGATGFLGSTAGVTEDGKGIAFARFESAAAAGANSKRPEQSAWWNETAKCYSGDVTFTDSEDTETFLGGGSNDAGFVQIMRGTADRDALHAMDEAFEQAAGSWRPDLLGVFRVWTGPNAWTDVAYFTNEAEAREGEKKDPPPVIAEQMGRFEQLMAGAEFIDLTDPWLY
ncbi:MAG TPA: hypothetical protein VKI01_05650 [Acidimicrobiia bacterium]|nr:hypothetical protein [Acidimicrobiia bacterium]